jgi:hypothetical protein
MRTFVVLSNGVPAVAVDRLSERKVSGEEDGGYAETRLRQVRVSAEGGGACLTRRIPGVRLVVVVTRYFMVVGQMVHWGNL